MGLIPESRKDQGLLLGRSIRDNVALPHLGLLSRLGCMRRRAEAQAAGEAAAAVDVRSSSIEQHVLELSGGNQQKSLFARWFLDTRSVLIADEPTRGVDVGAKRTIYDLIAAAAASPRGGHLSARPQSLGRAIRWSLAGSWLRLME